MIGSSAPFYMGIFLLLVIILVAYKVRNKRVKALIILVCIAFLGKIGWDSLLRIGISQDYQPTQPIAFSHKVHVGQNEIDCNYCHSSVEKGKVAGVPSLNVCMNCHFVVNEGTKTGTAEIEKIYKALDFNPETLEYGNNPTPVEWVRVHDLPDHVYFNHKQHVVVGKVECIECHGPVKSMEEIYQYSEMTMGWCVDCHRDKKIDTANSYYTKMEHTFTDEQRALFKKKKLTVAKNGGLECAKCHY